jgi:hypothetical protein
VAETVVVPEAAEAMPVAAATLTAMLAATPSARPSVRSRVQFIAAAILPRRQCRARG